MSDRCFVGHKHLTEELWRLLGNDSILANEPWSQYDEHLTKDDSIEIILQVTGKIRDKALIQAGTSQNELEQLALKSERLKPYLDGKNIVKITAVVDKMVNVVVK